MRFHLRRGPECYPQWKKLVFSEGEAQRWFRSRQLVVDFRSTRCLTLILVGCFCCNRRKKWTKFRGHGPLSNSHVLNKRRALDRADAMDAVRDAALSNIVGQLEMKIDKFLGKMCVAWAICADLGGQCLIRRPCDEVPLLGRPQNRSAVFSFFLFLKWLTDTGPALLVGVNHAFKCNTFP